MTSTPSSDLITDASSPQVSVSSTTSRVPFRVGVGYDSHRLAEGRRLVLGGVQIPFDKGLVGHSDADVVLHAIGDALCGAAGLPDIGQMFPDDKNEWQDADSRDLLAQINYRVLESGWQIGNVDAVLIAQKPKIAPYVKQMRSVIADVLKADVEQVNVRGKTAEGLGALGAGEGMACHAICLLWRK